MKQPGASPPAWLPFHAPLLSAATGIEPELLGDAQPHRVPCPTNHTHRFAQGSRGPGEVSRVKVVPVLMSKAHTLFS